ncbi:hypothetical protein BGZ65_007164 [Modicella reniformis]|uniref:Uncharacterized protein n=1 Tax=Modicella reniformis TaxID=1440133 RepID=A0A9P6J7A0_9FUNG|nr:hypothetical protein BGZ65_007164 [Modicella reniformis]
MYIPPAAITTTDNRWIDTIVTGSDRQITLAVLCSLINSALKYNPSGWGLPYNHVMFSDQRELLVMLCLQVVVVLLDYHVIEKPLSLSGSSSTGIHIDDQSRSGVDQTTTAPSLASPSESPSRNQFSHYLSRLHRDQDFMFLMDGMYRILSNPMAASSTYLPGSTKQVKCHQETLMLCWKMLELNKVSHGTLERREVECSNAKLGGSIILNTLSPPIVQRFRNYLLDTNRSVHNLISTTKRTLRSLYPALISTLSNVSPYLKNISPLASGRLLQLTTSFASPSFLLAEESNHELLSILLDTVCTVLYYQASDNPHLIYTLVQYEPKIQTMAGFTLQRGLDDIHKLRFQRMEALSARSGPATSESNTQLKASAAMDNRSRRLAATRQLSNLGGDGHGESSSSSSSSTQPLSHVKKSHGPKREGLIVATSGTLAVAASPCTTPSSLSFSPTLKAEDIKREGTPTIVPTLLRPDSTDLLAVEGWMRTLRFEPLLIMLRCVIPEIESIHAMNDHQVLEYIRSNIIPMLKKHLPESGRPHIVVRKFVWGDLVIWFEGLLWSQIYVGGGGRLGRQGLGAWYETGVRLFSIRTIPVGSSSSSTASASAAAVAAAATTVTDNVASVAAAAIRAAGSTFVGSSTASSSPTSSMPGLSSHYRSSISGASSTTATPLSSPRESIPRRTSIVSLGSTTRVATHATPSTASGVLSAESGPTTV